MRKRWNPHNGQIFFYGLLLVLISTNGMIRNTKVQGDDIQWRNPATIPGISLENYPPILVADQNRTVHAFSSQWMGDSNDSVKAIVYSEWTLQYGWSAPIDILVSPIGEARITAAYLDKKDTMHLIFFGGNGISGDIYYTKAPAVAAGSATSWSTPTVVGEDAGDPESAALVGDGHDRLSIIYHGKRDGHGVYVVNSEDGGETWSIPVPIFLAAGDAPYIFGIHAITSESGWIHVVWNTNSEAGQGRGIYYVGSDLKTSEWSDPLLLVSAEEGLGTQTPTIVEYKGVLFAVYNVTPKIAMRRSTDNGLNWDDPTFIFPRHVGVNGSLSLVIDNNDELHLFFGERISGTQGNPDIHGMWHSVWLNGRWTEPDAVVKAPRNVNASDMSGFDPYEAHAVVSQGNTLLVTWRTDPGLKGNGVWFSYATLNAPETPISTLQSPNLSEGFFPTSSFATSTVQVSAVPQINMDKERHGQNPFIWVIVGLLVFGFLWILYVIFTRR